MRLTDAIAEGRQAAFHGPPADGVAGLRRALADSDGSDNPVDSAAAAQREEATLLLGICLAAGGLFGSALEVVGPLWRAGSQHYGAAHCLAGSVFRQIGDFGTATEHDEAALDGATGSLRCEALLGRAADAVGFGQPEMATRHLAAAHEVWQPDWWREGIRLAWVDAEVALLAGEADRALPGLRTALATAQQHRAARHAAKTKLFLGVAIRTGAPDDATAEHEAYQLLEQAAADAEQLGTWPLVWAIGTVRQQWLSEADAHADAHRASLAAARAASVISSDLPDELRAVWLRRPDVHILEP